MNISIRNLLAAALLVWSPAAMAGAPGDVRTEQIAPVSAAPASAAERKSLTRQFVAKWSGYVQRVYGISGATWAKRMEPVFATADPTNFRQSLKQESFDAAIAEISGVGSQPSGGATSAGPSTSAAGVAPALLGDLGQDLVYTPVAPCRIVDTRSTAAGAIAANATRSFVAVNASNFVSQGGSSTNCGTQGLSATAVAVNITAVFPTAAGFATVYPFGTSRPLASSVNYTANSIVNNAIVAQIPNPLSSFDFTVYTFAQSHYVVDIVGYFAPPLATALQCVDTADTVTTVAAGGGTANSTAPLCPAGYTQTGTNCEGTSWDMAFVFMSGGVCSAKNPTTSTQTIRSSRTCCRVPGR